MPSSSPATHPLTRLAVLLFDAARVLPVERDRWLGAGFEPTEALNFLSAGVTLQEAVDARAASLTANDLARHRSRVGASIVINPIRLEVTDRAEALEQLNRDDGVYSLDPRTTVHLDDWDLVPVADANGRRWWLPVGVGDGSLADHGDRLYSFGDAYFAWIGLDRFPRALGRYATVDEARAAIAASAPIAQVSLSWGRRVLGGTGIVWDLHTHETPEGTRFSLTNDEFGRALINGSQHDNPLLAPSSHETIDDAFAAIGRTSFVVDGLLIVHLPTEGRSGFPIRVESLRSLVPTDSLEYRLRGSGRPALMLNGQDYLAVSVEYERLPVLLPVRRDDHGSVDLDTVFDLNLATYHEVNGLDERVNWYALGLTGELPIVTIARDGEPPVVLGFRENSSFASLVRSWLHHLSELVDAPAGIDRIVLDAIDANGIASGDTHPLPLPDGNPFRYEFDVTDPYRGTLDLGLDERERAELAALLAS